MCERESDQKRKLVAAQNKQSSKCNFQSSDLFFKPLSQSKVFPELLKGGGEGHLFQLERGWESLRFDFFDERKYTVALYSICTMCEEA